MQMNHLIGNKQSGKCEYKKDLLFKEFICEEKVQIPCQKPDIEEVVSIIVEPEIFSLRVIDTPKGLSQEGQYLSGKKVSIEIKLRQKIMYISKTLEQSVHVVENECYKSTYIVIADKLYGNKIEDLINTKYITPKITVERANGKKIDDRNIFKSITLFIELKLCPTYVLCYSEDYNCTKSILYISCEDGTKKKEIACVNKCKIYKPKWSPYGKKIAYICYNKYSSFLCLSTLCSKSVKVLTDPYIFQKVTSFSWDATGKKIYFSAYFKENKEIFCIDIITLQWSRLTYSPKGCDNFKVKVSSDGKKIAYIKKKSSKSNIYIMNPKGLDTKQITTSGKVKDFCWQNDNKSIIYVSDEIYIIDILMFNEIKLNMPLKNLNVRNISASSNNRYIAFIGTKQGCANIYIYDLIKNTYTITNYGFGIEISDFEWNNESTKLYYACKEFTYFNIYEFTVCDESIKQISNTCADNIRLSYKSRII